MDTKLICQKCTNCHRQGKPYKNRKSYDKHIHKCKGPKKSSQKRKQTDYQFTELLVALSLLGLSTSDKKQISDFAEEKKKEGLLECPYLDKYLEDGNSDVYTNDFVNDYIENFKIQNTDIPINDIVKVYLTGKSYTDFPELVNLNEEAKKRDIKPKSDVYFKYKKCEKFIIDGISCKQNSTCTNGNNVSERHMNDTIREQSRQSRVNVLNEDGITLENWENLDPDVFNKAFYGDNKYWDELIKFIIENNEKYIQDVNYSVAQGAFLKYNVYKYDGSKLTNTEHEKLDSSKCKITKSNIFYFGKKGKRNTAKAFLDFMYDDKILYKLEIRFKIGSNKKSYFKKGGSPQTFIYKPTKKEIEYSTKSYEQSLINNSV